VELLLKLCTWRNLVLAAMTFAAILSASRLQQYPRRWVQNWRYPPQGSAGAAGDEIMGLKEKREAAAVVRRGEKVQSMLAQAEAEGFNVAALRLKADAALRFNDDRSRRKAVLMLAEVEFAVPHKRIKYSHASPVSDDDDVPANVPGRGVGKSHR
jgi:hypothetical protein